MDDHNGLNYRRVGDVSELMFVLYCLRKGWHVAEPIGENTPGYDFLLSKDGDEWLKVEVKTVGTYQGKRGARLASTRFNQKEKRWENRPTNLASIDYLAMVDADKGTLSLIEAHHITESALVMWDKYRTFAEPVMCELVRDRNQRKNGSAVVSSQCFPLFE